MYALAQEQRNNADDQTMAGDEPWGLWIMNPGGEKLQEDDVPMTVTEPLGDYDFRPGM